MPLGPHGGNMIHVSDEVVNIMYMIWNLACKLSNLPGEWKSAKTEPLCKNKDTSR